MHNLTVETLETFIRLWAKKRGIQDKSTIHTQFEKLLEEVGEAKAELDAGDLENFDMEIGDCLIVIINLLWFRGKRIGDVLEAAYEKIERRTGKMVDGKFVKGGDL